MRNQLALFENAIHTHCRLGVPGRTRALRGCYKYHKIGAIMMIYQREPVFTIGRTPFVAGAIHFRNQMRLLKQRQRARRRKAFISSLARLVPARTGVSRAGLT